MHCNTPASLRSAQSSNISDSSATSVSSNSHKIFSSRRFLRIRSMALFLATLNIYLLETGSLKELFYWNARKFAGYPVSIFHKAIQIGMIYIVPFAFVNYFPAQFLLRKEDMAAYPEIYLYLTPVLGIVLYLLAYAFWRYSIKFYKSSGN